MIKNRIVFFIILAFAAGNPWIIAGVRTDGSTGDYTKTVDAKVGDVIDANMFVANTTGERSFLGVQLVLPEGLTLVENSAKLYDSLNSGSALGDITKRVVQTLCGIR